MQWNIKVLCGWEGLGCGNTDALPAVTPPPPLINSCYEGWRLTRWPNLDDLSYLSLFHPPSLSLYLSFSISLSPSPPLFLHGISLCLALVCVCDTVLECAPVLSSGERPLPFMQYGQSPTPYTISYHLGLVCGFPGPVAMQVQDCSYKVAPGLLKMVLCLCCCGQIGLNLIMT